MIFCTFPVVMVRTCVRNPLHLSGWRRNYYQPAAVYSVPMLTRPGRRIAVLRSCEVA